MEKASHLEMMTDVFGKELKKKSVSRKDLFDAIEQEREQMWEKFAGKAYVREHKNSQ